MPEDQSSKKTSRRKQKSVPSFDESILDEPEEDVENTDSAEKIIPEGLSDMSEEEMIQHMKLCFKLSVENKINKKNAFGLRLIDIMQKIVNRNEKADIKQASLSLQASSKIYAGRVEALYEDTVRFHGYLQSITGGKKDKKNMTTEDEDEICEGDEDGAENRRSKPQKSKCKSSLKSEESLSMEQNVSSLNTGEPHGNFVVINSAFSTSRLAPKLLSCLQCANDSCTIRCAIPAPSFKPINALSNTTFPVPAKWKGIVEKIKNFNVSQAKFQTLMTPTEVTISPHMSTPKPVPSLLFDDDNDDAFAAPFDVSIAPAPASDEHSVESAPGRQDLNITADIFVNDISAAVTDQGIDHTLLPPNSVLKKMLDRSKRTSIKPTVTKTTRQKTKEPFFAGKSAKDIKHLFVKGRGTCISERALSKWNIENISNIDLVYEFIEEVESKKRHGQENNSTLDDFLDVLKQNDPEYHFYFQKQSQMWKFSRRKLCLNESQLGTSFNNQTEKRVGSLAPNDPEALALSLQNLSLHDSMHEIPDSGENASFDEAPALSDLVQAEDLPFENFSSQPEAFESEIDNLMVKPPELVRPTSMKFDKRPVNLNIEEIKELMWSIISKHLEGNNSVVNEETFVLFSVVYEELKTKLEREISEVISMQFAFTVLLILANQKTLLIEDVKENTDLSIKQDISEIDVTDNM